MSRFLRPGWLIIYVIMAMGLWWFFDTPKLHFDNTLVIEEWDTLSAVLDGQGWLDSYRIKHMADSHNFDPSMLSVGTYPQLSWSVSVADFYAALHAGPTSAYEKVTILEGWSIYDTDALLTRKWRIRPGEYVSYVTDASVIRDVRRQYSFLEILPDAIQSLEWFLYPETYFIDKDDPVLPQLVRLQLQSFYDSIWVEQGNAILSARRWRGVDLSPYELLVVASVVLKEERHEDYQPLVAWVFLNRLQSDMRIDADITLCYGLAQPYESCTPSVIVQHLRDASNVYNTRAVKWLPPTAISSLTPASVRAVVAVEDHDYLYYLHDPRGVIHPAQTSEGHLHNKNTYLQ